MAAKRTRLLILISGLDIGGAHGGAERFGLELGRNLDKEHFEVALCAFWKRGGQAEAHWQRVLDDDGIPVVFAAEWRGRFDPLEYLRGLLHLREYLDPPADILHSHYQMGTLAAILLKLSGKARAAMRTAHVSVEWGEGPASWICRQTLTNWIYPLLLDCEAGVSRAVVSALERHPGSRLSGKRPSLVHNAIYPEVFRENSRAENHPALEQARGDLVVGSVGRFTTQKGYRYLIAAAPTVLERLPNVTFVLVGDGELRQELQSQALNLGIADKILFAGQRPDVLPLIKSMDLFVLPSIYEGLPTVVMESMASGVPVVATDIPGTDELVRSGENGWLVPARQPQELAQAIVAALENPHLRQLYAQRAKDTVAAFRIEAIAGQYEALYRAVLGEGATSAVRSIRPQ